MASNRFFCFIRFRFRVFKPAGEWDYQQTAGEEFVNICREQNKIGKIIVLNYIWGRRREQPKTAEKSRSGDYENQNFWGLEENFSLQFHQLLAKSHPVRMSSSVDNIINICKRFMKSQARFCDPEPAEPRRSNSKVSMKIELPLTDFHTPKRIQVLHSKPTYYIDWQPHLHLRCILTINSFVTYTQKKEKFYVALQGLTFRFVAILGLESYLLTGRRKKTNIKKPGKGDVNICWEQTQIERLSFS